MKQCVICKHGTVKPGKTTFLLERNAVIMVIKEIPALVCENCGEGYVDEPTMSRLEQLAETAVKEGVQFDIRRYVAA